MVQKVGEMLSGIEIPKLTDYTATNYQGVMDATMAGYKSAMEAVTSKIQVDQQQYSRKVDDINQAQKRAAARAQYEAQNSRSGKSTLEQIGQLGSDLVTGLVAMEEVKRKKEEAAFQRQMQLEEHQMKKERHQFDLGQDQEEQRLEKLGGVIGGVLADAESNFYDTATQYGLEQGLSAFDTSMEAFTQSENFQMLSPQDQAYVRQQITEKRRGLRKEQFNNRRAEHKEIQSTLLDGAMAQVDLAISPLANSLATGAVDDPDVAIQDMYGTGMNILNTPEFDAVKNDPILRMKFHTDLLENIVASSDAYYEKTGKRVAGVNDYRNALQGINSIEALQDSGEISDVEAVALKKQVMLQNGLSDDPDDLPGSRQDMMEREVKDNKTRQEITDFEIRNQRVADSNKPEVQAAKELLVGESIFRILNGKGQTVDGRVAQLKQLQKDDPNRFAAEFGDMELALLEKYPEDKKKLNQIEQQIKDTQRTLARLTENLDPSPRERTRNAGDPVMSVDPDTGEARFEPAVGDEKYIDTPASSGSAEEIQAVKEKLELQKRERDLLLRPWAQHGINLANPSDPTYLNKKREDTQAIIDTIAADSQANGKTPTNTDPLPPASTSNANSSQFDMNNALQGEIDRLGLLKVDIGLSDNIRTSKPELTTSLSSSLSVYQEQTVFDAKEIAAGRNPDPDALENRLDGITLAVERDDGDVTNLNKTKRQLIEKRKRNIEVLKGKKRWYDNRYVNPPKKTEPSQPVNQVSRDDREAARRNTQPGQTTTVQKSEAPGAPSQVAASALAVDRKFGYFMPFSAGVRVEYSSDFKGHTRTGKPHRASHNGIDIYTNDNDRSLRTVQGGEIVKVYTPQESGGYGNAVAVRTPDGRIEFFAHLSSVSVKKGDKVTSGTKVGVMGETGGAKGVHLHFEVWKAGTDPNSYGKGLQEDPYAYLGMVTQRHKQPRGQGASPSGTHSQSTNTGSTTTIETSLINLGGGVFYSNGYVIDRNSLQYRKATSDERSRASTGTPMTIVRSTGTSGGTATTTTNHSDGSVEHTTYQVPSEAKNLGTYIMVSPTGRTASNGMPILGVRVVKNNKQIIFVEAISGRTGISGDRTTAGAGGMLMDGKYFLDSTAFTSSADGLSHYSMRYDGNTSRSGIGISYDANGDKTSEGGIEILNKGDYDRFSNFVKRNPGFGVYVVTEKSGNNSTYKNGNSTYTGLPMKGNKVSQNFADHDYKNDPNADYGIAYLKKDPEARKALAEVGNALGIPAVVIADIINDVESGFDKAIRNKQGSGATGLIQLMPFNFAEVGRRGIGRPLTLDDFRTQSVAWQIRNVVKPFLEMTLAQAGLSEYRDAREVIAGIFGGGGALKRERNGTWNGSDGNINANEYFDRMGTKSGRDYSYKPGEYYSNTVAFHENPRGDCSQCQLMLTNGEFYPHEHEYKTNMMIA